MKQRPRKSFWHGTTILLACLLLTIAWGNRLNASDKPVETEKLGQVLTKVLATQSRAWNDADIDGFMEH